VDASGVDTLVSDAMRRDYPIISGFEMLQAALDKLQTSDCRVLHRAAVARERSKCGRVAALHKLYGPVRATGKRSDF
jgi:hypothetical protein